MSSGTMQSAWKNLGPESVPERDSEDEPTSVVGYMVYLGRCTGLEVDDGDVEELVEDPRGTPRPARWQLRSSFQRRRS